MSSNYNLLIFVIASVVSIAAPSSVFNLNADDICKNMDPETVTYLSVDGNCGAYIECYRGIATYMQCPTGLWWHHQITDCDYPGLYCAGWHSEICIGADPNQITYKPLGGDCTQYVECYNDVATLSVCPIGTWWHQEIEACDYPGDYCIPDSEPTTPTTTTTTTTTATTTTTTTATTTTTPTTTPTTPTTPTTTSIPTTTPSHGPGPDPRCVDNNTNYWPHPVLCSRFIECYQGDSYEMMCPPDLYFSDSKKECVPAHQSECCAHIRNRDSLSQVFKMSNYNLLIFIIASVVSIAASYSVFNAKADDICKYADPETITYLSVDGNCGAYIECYRGIATYMECPQGLWWHHQVQNCDYPGLYCAGWHSEICVGTNANEISYKPIGTDCTQYVECYNYVAQLFTCSPGTWWHQEIETCDFPGDYCTPAYEPTTSTKSTTTTTITPSTTPTTPSSVPHTTTPSMAPTTTSTTPPTTSTTSIPTTTPSNGDNPDPRCVDNNTSYWPHPVHCSRYIECYQGDSYEMNCPSNLYFSDATKSCVSAHQSECCAEKGC